jgi:hypothetical protein
MARPGNGQRSREPRDAATGDNELHTPNLSGRRRSVSRWGERRHTHLAASHGRASERTSHSAALREERHSRGGDTIGAAAGSPVVKDVAARIAGKAFKTLRLPPPDPERAAGRRDRGAVGQG